MAQPARRPDGPAHLTTFSLMVLIGVEVFAVALSAAWALAGLFELGDYLAYGLMVLFGLFACWLMLQLWRRAASIDPLG